MATATIRDSRQTFTITKILCIGRNYAEHAKEMKADIPKEPVFFLKPPTAVIHDGGKVRIPDISKEMHHEVELTILVGKAGSSIPLNEARSHIAGFGVGLDMTLRDVQAEAKKKGLPWSLAKGFDTSAPLSEFVPVRSIPDPSTLKVRLSVNAALRQEGSLSDLLFPVDALVSYLSRYISLEPGDVIYTGTPEGVAQALPGDKLEASLLDEHGAMLTAITVNVA